MDKQDVQTVSLTKSTSLKRIPVWLLIFIGFLLSLFISIPVSLLEYQLGYKQGKQEQTPSHSTVTITNKKELTTKQTGSKNSDGDDSSQEQIPSYILIYTPPAGWQSMVWHPDANSVGSALVSPDYTSISDPNPQTGFSILIYQFPQQYNDMSQLRPFVEQTEEGLTSLTQTTIAGFSAFHTIYNDSDAGRILEDYDILKGHDHWIVRIDFPGNSFPAMQAEEQKYGYAINELLQSIQFKTIQSQ